MDLRVGFLLLCVLGAICKSDGRQVPNSNESVLQTSYLKRGKGSQILDENFKSSNVCTLCETFTTEALDYLAENTTQTEILEALHEACSMLRFFKQECVNVVDYYASLIFSEVTSLEPAVICQKLNLCEAIAVISSQIQEDSCGFCRETASQILDKLKDPDTQLEVIEMLLKACNSMDNYAKKCKRLIFQYGPLIVANAEKFLETTDICTTLHACSPADNGRKATSLVIESVLSDS